MVLQTEQTERLRKILHIDITDGMILAVTNQGKRQENFKHEAMDSWMQRHVFAYASNKKTLESMKKEFACSALLGEFQAGKSLLVYRCQLVKKDMMLVDKVTLYLFENTLTGHVEAQMFMEDITQEYLDSITNEVLYQKDYKVLSLISLDRQIVNFRSIHLAHTDIEERKNIPYQSAIKRICDQHIHPMDRERFQSRIGLDFLGKTMEHQGHYSFAVRTTSDRTERYTFYW